MFIQKVPNLPKSDRVCEIYPDKNWKLSRFETNSEKLKQAAMQMGTKVMKEFGGTEEFKL